MRRCDGGQLTVTVRGNTLADRIASISDQLRAAAQAAPGHSLNTKHIAELLDDTLKLTTPMQREED